jgi:uncharacterized protein (TIGR02058 family)
MMMNSCRCLLSRSSPARLRTVPVSALTCSENQFQLKTSENSALRSRRHQAFSSSSTSSSSWSNTEDRPAWSEEWKRLGLGAQLVNEPRFPQNLFFVQLGWGVDQHGDRANATKAAARALRNAIEFNSIPGVVEHIPGGRKEMLIHVKLGIPQGSTVDVLELAKVFPYGKLLPIELSVGGLEFATGRVVEELGDTDDVGTCVVACVSIGYNDQDGGSGGHKTFNTKDGH